MYNEEIQESGVNLIEAQGLPMGRFVYDPSEVIYPNMVISTEEDGPMWYGDLTISDVPRLQTVANQLNKTLMGQSKTGFGLKELTVFPTN